MGIIRWLAKLFGHQSNIPDGLPDVMGHIVDEHGDEHELYKGPIQHDAVNRVGLVS